MSVPESARVQQDSAREARRWHLRLKDPSASVGDHREFEAWCAEEPARRHAYAEEERLWDKLSAPAHVLGNGGWYRGRVSRVRARSAVLALAASLAFIVVAIWWRDPGLAVRAFADYAAAPATQKTVQLSDGSQVVLDGDTAIRVDLEPRLRRVTLLRGRAWFDVAHDASRPFFVNAGEAGVRVLGTAFSVERLPDGVTVAVERGHVATYASGLANAVELSAGESARIPGNCAGDGPYGKEAPIVSEPVMMETAFAWRRGLVVFDGASLDSVAQELSRIGAGRVLILGSELGNRRISGVFSSKDPDGILTALETGLGVRVTHVPGIAAVIHR